MLYVIDICYIKKVSGSIGDAIVKLVLRKLTLAQVDVRYGYDKYGLWRSFDCIPMDRPLLFLCQCFTLCLKSLD